MAVSISNVGVCAEGEEYRRDKSGMQVRNFGRGRRDGGVLSGDARVGPAGGELLGPRRPRPRLSVFERRGLLVWER
jgi:hypothetical protein